MGGKRKPPHLGSNPPLKKQSGLDAMRVLSASDGRAEDEAWREARGRDVDAVAIHSCPESPVSLADRSSRPSLEAATGPLALILDVTASNNRKFGKSSQMGRPVRPSISADKKRILPVNL